MRFLLRKLFYSVSVRYIFQVWDLNPGRYPRWTPNSLECWEKCPWMYTQTFNETLAELVNSKGPPRQFNDPGPKLCGKPYSQHGRVLILARLAMKTNLQPRYFIKCHWVETGGGLPHKTSLGPRPPQAKMFNFKQIILRILADALSDSHAD